MDHFHMYGTNIACSMLTDKFTIIFAIILNTYTLFGSFKMGMYENLYIYI